MDEIFTIVYVALLKKKKQERGFGLVIFNVSNGL